MDPIILEEGLVITHSRSLTSGKISSQLFALALPLLLGNILQQLYNVVAAVIVGQYIGEEAFAAIGVAGTVMNLFIFVLIGGCTGVSIILASLFGSGDFHSLRKESFLAIVFGAGFTLVVSLVSIMLLSPLLESINTPPRYLRIRSSTCSSFWPVCRRPFFTTSAQPLSVQSAIPATPSSSS